MRSSTLASGLLACVLAACAAAPAYARHRHHHQATTATTTTSAVPDAIPPSEDAVQLSDIAPPSREGTAVQTYGDASFARARMQSRYPGEEEADAHEAGTAGVPYPCDPRTTTASAYVCHNNPAERGYGQGYAFTPSYVSSPNVFMQDKSEQSPVMPPITAFFWAVNSARVDPH